MTRENEQARAHRPAGIDLRDNAREEALVVQWPASSPRRPTPHDDARAEALVVQAADDASLPAAEQAANATGAPLARDAAEGARARVILRASSDGLALEGDGMTLRQDFARMLPRLKPGRLRGELLVKAARLKGPSEGAGPLVVDATAGLGEDALLLAAAGFRVRLFERNAVIALMLQDALRRAASDPALASIVARMEFSPGDSTRELPRMSPAPDVVYLDPMFPERTKSAAVKKKFQLLHHLEQPCDDEEELLAAAFAARPRKVVVKRPPKGPWLAGKKPSHSIEGKAVRYDCYVLPR